MQSQLKTWMNCKLASAYSWRFAFVCVSIALHLIFEPKIKMFSQIDMFLVYLNDYFNVDYRKKKKNAEYTE